MRRVLSRLRGSFDLAARLDDALVRRRVRLLDSLSGQVALVTGGNRGIGAEIARQLAARGATVYVGARDLATVGDSDHRPVELDVTARDQIEAALDRIANDAGRLDVLVNNAGVYGPTGRLGELDPADAERTIGVNLHGSIAVTRAALPLLTEREGSRIVNVSSQSGQFVGGIESESLPYGVSKAGLNAFTAALADQYPDLVVNAACPGPTRTDMVGPSAPRSVEEGADTPAWVARFAPGSPTGRLWKDRQPIGW